MAEITIPMSDYSNFKVGVTLDAKKFFFDFVWNTRGEFWSASIADANGNLLIAGIRLVLFTPLLIPYQYNASVPQGALMVIDQNPSTFTEEPRRHDFVQDRNLQLCYKEVNE